MNYSASLMFKHKIKIFLEMLQNDTVCTKTYTYKKDKKCLSEMSK